ncbi:hypothetical protein [Parasphingorhabdus sp.]|uniref:hypothetical protein n=1 Tax=Parasphingorhabdus sp. TaxID=2709688 RepID=UPI0039E62381
MKNEVNKIMLSEIERIFPTIFTNIKIDIYQLVTVRKNRAKLFNDKYFSNKFWDIILLLYSHEINELPIDSKVIAENLELSHTSVARYLHALFADGIVCAYDEAAGSGFDLENDNLSLTQQGFENTARVVQQVRQIFTTATKP